MPLSWWYLDDMGHEPVWGCCQWEIAEALANSVSGPVTVRQGFVPLWEGRNVPWARDHGQWPHPSAVSQDCVPWFYHGFKTMTGFICPVHHSPPIIPCNLHRMWQHGCWRCWCGCSLCGCPSQSFPLPPGLCQKPLGYNHQLMRPWGEHTAKTISNSPCKKILFTEEILNTLNISITQHLL